MLQILLYRFIRDVAGAPCSVADGPKVSAPIFLAQGREFLLQPPRCPSFHPLDQIRQRLRWPILYVHVHMIFADHSLQNSYIFGITDLHQQIAAAQLDVPLQHRISVLCYPYQVRGKPRYRVPAVSVFPHRARLLSRSKRV